MTVFWSKEHDGTSNVTNQAINSNLKWDEHQMKKRLHPQLVEQVPFSSNKLLRGKTSIVPIPYFSFPVMACGTHGFSKFLQHVLKHMMTSKGKENRGWG